MKDRTLDFLTAQLKQAHSDLFTRLAVVCPVGQRAGFFIMHGQKNESTGTITGYRFRSDFVFVVVRHHQAKPGSRYAFREVTVEDIQWVRP